MRRRSHAGPPLRGPVVCCLLSVAALSLGPTGERAVRAAIRDAARPGFDLARAAAAFRADLDLGRWPWTARDVRDRPDSRASKADPAGEAELRRLRVELAAARRDLATFDQSLGPVGRQAAGSTHGPAVERIAARVLNRSESATGPGGLVVAAGAVQGVEPSRPAVTPIGLAAGAEAGVPGDAVVLVGAAVLGRTDEVGAWTSTVVPVTDASFRAHVRIVRQTENGTSFGEEGLLEGDGRDGCVVRYVPSTAAVSVGDHVYSYDSSGRIPQPLYFGRIEAAALRDGAPHWDIRVRPAARPDEATEVHVLCPKPGEFVTAAN